MRIHAWMNPTDGNELTAFSSAPGQGVFEVSTERAPNGLPITLIIPDEWNARLENDSTLIVHGPTGQVIASLREVGAIVEVLEGHQVEQEA